MDGHEEGRTRWSRRPLDRLRLVLALLAIVVVFGLALLQRAVPQLLISPVVFLAGVAMAVAPALAAVERLLGGEGRRVAEGVVGALATYLLALGINLYVLGPGPDALRDLLAHPGGDGTTVSPLHLYIATVVAFSTLVGFGDRLLLRNATWAGMAITATAHLAEQRATLVGMLTTFLLGRAVAFGLRWAHGAPDPAPGSAAVATALTGAGLTPVDLRAAESGGDSARHYRATERDGRALHVVVLDRDGPAVGLTYRLYQWLRLRRPAQSRGLVSLQHVVEQRTLLALAVRDSGVRTPRLLAVRPVGPDAVLLAYEHVEGRTPEQLAPEERTDELLGRIWQLTEQLHAHHITHRRLAADAFLVDGDGTVWLTRLEAGAVAADLLQQRLDRVELLATLAMLTDADRAVASARAALGDAEAAALLPLLRPAVLSSGTRSRLLKHKKVLEETGKAIVALRPEATPPRAPGLERLRPRTILSALGGVVAVYFLLGQFAGKSPADLFRGVEWGWAAAAFGTSLVTYVAAAMALGGFVPQRLPKVRLVLAQFAADFVTLVTPAAVGGIAVNTRFLTKAGVASGLAVTCMAASQLVALAATLLLVMLLGSISGAAQGDTGLPASSVIITVLLAVAVVCVVVAAVPALRRFVVARVKPYFAGVGPRMLELLRDPRRLAVGIGGAFLLPLAYSATLWASTLAFEDEKQVDFATVAVVFLIGKTAGSVVPTPGGLGAVEALLSGGLSAATGISGSTAFSAVVLFRLITFWLPILPGWVATTWLQRKEAL